MQQAIQLAKQAWGKTSPNPLVGAIIVKDNKIIGKGYHHKAGLPHAEPIAIAQAKEQTYGATLYVTLEPCSTTGRTPPCTEAIINAKIKKVVIGSLDPNPKHTGNAITILQHANIQVVAPILEKECKALNEPFFHWITTNKPFVSLKMAMTLDGKIATQNGNSKWITGKEARQYVQQLRQQADAIMVGGETVRCDNPSLTVRQPKNWQPQPQKIIWTSKTELSSELQIFVDSSKPPIFVSPNTPQQWQQLLHTLGDQNITSLLIEGGGELAANALQNQIIDKIYLFIAPKILTGRNSRPVIAGNNPESLLEAIPVTNLQTKNIGQDILITSYPNYKK